MKIGDKIILKPEWMDEGDENADFQVAELRGDRTLVIHANSPLPIKPTFIIQNYMIENI